MSVLGPVRLDRGRNHRHVTGDFELLWLAQHGGHCGDAQRRQNRGPEEEDCNQPAARAQEAENDTGDGEAARTAPKGHQTDDQGNRTEESAGREEPDETQHEADQPKGVGLCVGEAA